MFSGTVQFMPLGDSSSPRNLETLSLTATLLADNLVTRAEVVPCIDVVGIDEVSRMHRGVRSERLQGVFPGYWALSVP